MTGTVRDWINESRRHIRAAGSEESLPDRLINPDEYGDDLTNPVAVQVENNLRDHFSNEN